MYTSTLLILSGLKGKMYTIKQYETVFNTLVRTFSFRQLINIDKATKEILNKLFKR